MKVSLQRLTKIKYRLMSLVILATLLASLLMTAVFVSYTLNLLKSQRDHQITTQLAILASNLDAALMFEDRATVRRLIQGLSADPEILYVAVYKYDSEFSAVEFLNQGAGQTLDLIAEDGGNSHYQQAIVLDGEQLGELTVYASNQSLTAQIRLTLATAVLAFLLVVTLVYLASFPLRRAITGPVEALINLTRQVRNYGDYSLRAKVDSNDEVGLLAQDFNAMLDQIEQRDLMLEKTVQQRTAELEKLADDFRHRAFHDSLTGLPNRALLAERFDAVVAHARRLGQPFGLFLIDLDNFKNINDTLGHDVGDELLKTIAKRLLRTLREEDIVCRLGGDEFLIVAEELNKPHAADRVANKLLTALGEVVVVNDKRLDVTMSIGCALFPQHGTELTGLKRAADIAMYQAKEAGKNQHKMFHPEMERTTQHRLMVQNELRDALAAGDILLFYQPQVDAISGQVYGCEVLVRWLHPQHGLLYPDMFIPYAEESGLVQLVDYYVLEQACHQARRWLDEGRALIVSVNLSGLHFRDSTVVARLRAALQVSGLPPEYLGIELTEAVLISDAELATRVVTDIKALGIKISLDDFGVGYSSLNYLRMLPFDVVKLDKSFIHGILTHPQDQRLTEGIMKLAGGLGLKVVAEGVESGEQMDYLTSIHCRLMQGYFFLPPKPKEEFERWRQDWAAKRQGSVVRQFPGRRNDA